MTEAQRWSPNLWQAVSDRGWALLRCEAPESLMDLATQLGTPVPSRSSGSLVQRLIPLDRKLAAPNSLSARYGLDPLPFHTDLAHRRIPPRFVLLRLAAGSSSDRPTLVVDREVLPLSEKEKTCLKREVWLVNGGRGRFYTTVVNDTICESSSIIRFDPCCMRPALASRCKSREILATALNSVTPHRVDWTQGMILILDNWRILHARGAASDVSGTKRVLDRVLVA